MALPARQPIQDDESGLGKAAANDNFEIKNASVKDGAKVSVEGNKIKFNLQNTKKIAANDDVEIDQTPKTATPTPAPQTPTPTGTTPEPADPAPATSPSKLTTDKPEESIQPKKNNNQPNRPVQNQQQNDQVLPPNDPQKPAGNEENNKPRVEDKTQPQPENFQPTTDEQIPQNNQPDSQNNQLTPQSDRPEPEKPITNENIEKQSAGPNTPIKDDLYNTGPHTNTNKEPKTISPQNQAKASSDLSSSKRSGAGNMIQSGKQALQNTAKKTIDSAKSGIKNKVNNIAQSLQSDRGRKIQLGRQRRKLESELRRLENKMDGVNASKYMRIIRFWFPSIYAAISGLGSGMANAKGEAKVAMLTSKLISAQTIKTTLKTAEGVSALVEANIKVISWIAESIETVVIPILLILVYPILIIILWIYIEFMGAMNAPITKSIKELVKEVDQIIESLEKILKPEREKIKKRREIQVINRLMAASSQDRKIHLQQQKEQEEYENAQKQTGQNNNTNSQPTS